MSQMSRPTCAECPQLLVFKERVPRKERGVTLRPGERYCTAEKRPRRFHPSEPKVYPPKWCPRKIFPYVLRVYEENRWMFFYAKGKKRRVCDKRILYPSAYDLRFTGTSKWSGRDVLEILRQRKEQDRLRGLADVEELLEIKLFPGMILEFDDGLKPMFYLAHWNGMRQVIFDKPRAEQK